MSIVGVRRGTSTRGRRTGAALLVLGAAVLLPLLLGSPGSAANSPAVPLATAADYAVLGGSTVTNTNGSVLDGSLGLWPGPSIVGFPPGIVLPPGVIDTTNAAAQQAQRDLTAAYNNAAGREVHATTTADLADLHLSAGVYAGPSHGALSLTGPLVLDGGGDMSSVFIFQTDSSLITASGSTVSLVNGAQACNVFWQVGSSATLGTDSVFTGNLMALTSITVNNSVTVHGRALARNGAVTLDNDVFTEPTCATGSGTTTTTSGGGGTTTTTSGGTGTTIGILGGGNTSTTAAGGGGGNGGGGNGGGGGGGTPTTQPRGGPGTPTTGPGTTLTELPRTGSELLRPVAVGFTIVGLGVAALWFGRPKDEAEG